MQKPSSDAEINRYLHLKARKNRIPLAGVFELTPCCNLACRMCYVRKSAEEVRSLGGLMNGAEWIELGREAVKNGLLFLLITGGEPLTHPDFKSIYQSLHKMGVIISLNTNGTMIDDDMADFLAKNTPSRVNVTIYGASPETYETLCGNGSAYDRAVDGLRRLHARGINVKVNFSITPYNYKDLPRVVALANELDCQFQCASYMFPALRRGEENIGRSERFSPEIAARCQLESDRLTMTPEKYAQRRENILAGIPDTDRECMDMPTEHIRCRAGSSSFWLTWDGTLLPCGMMTQPAYSVKELGFRAAWDGVYDAAAQIVIPARCTACSYRHACMLCPAAAVTETGHFDHYPPYLCQMTGELMKLMREEEQHEHQT